MSVYYHRRTSRGKMNNKVKRGMKWEIAGMAEA